MARHRFILDQFEEFLTGGNVAAKHDGPIPIWAGYIIEQNARILEILMTDIETQLKADIASLVDSNTKLVDYETQQVAQIADLQGQIAALKNQVANGQTPSADTLAALDSITQQIAGTATQAHATASASATSPAPATPVVEPQAPVTSQPIETVPATTPDTVATPVVPVQAPVTSDSGKVSGADAEPATSDSGTATDTVGQ
ncbi:RodZ family helix-turn-helix domain-containing protein [Nocardia tengchongensis]|uniref:hypothetical protein n=1 Tax=Nocardia tengchongensis TaxID=2055889 RepID=UPI0036640D7E